MKGVKNTWLILMAKYSQPMKMKKILIFALVLGSFVTFAGGGNDVNEGQPETESWFAGGGNDVNEGQPETESWFAGGANDVNEGRPGTPGNN